MSTFQHLNSEAGRMDRLITSLMTLPSSPVWIHESHIHNAISLPRGPNFGQYHALSCILSVIAEGHGGNRRKKGDPKAFYSVNERFAGCFREGADNNHPISYQTYGSAELFDAGSLAVNKTSMKARWFRVEDEKTTVVCELKTQLTIVLEATGDDSIVMEVPSRRRRKDNVNAFLLARSNDGGYSNYEVPLIAFKYRNQLRKIFTSPLKDGWNERVRYHVVTNEPVFANKMIFEEAELVEFEQALRLMLAIKLEQGKLDVADRQWVHTVSERRRGQRVLTVRSLTPTPVGGVPSLPPPRSTTSSSRSRSRTPPPSAVSSTTTSTAQLTSRSTASSVSQSIPDSLRVSSLGCVTDEGNLIVTKISQLAAFEFIFYFMQNNNISMNGTLYKLDEFAVEVPPCVSNEELIALSPTNISNAVANIAKARTVLVKCLSSAKLACPRDNQLLIDWQQDCIQFNHGMNFEACNFEENNSGNGNRSLTLEAAFIIRHIMSTLSIPLTRFPTFWASFYFLIMRKPIKEDQLASQNQLWNHTRRVSLIDAEIRSLEFRDAITRRTPNGFRINFGMISDKSKHGRRERSILLITTNISSDPDVIDPSFRLLTASACDVKTSDYSSNNNVSLFTSKLGLQVVGHFGGGCNDNAPDAQKEIRVTFDKCIAALEESDDPSIQELAYENGVLREPIINGDAYHIANLVVTGMSIKAYGDTVKGDFRQIHHRQCMQTLHDLISANKELAQEILNDIMAGGESFTLYSVRERVQRWLVNQRYSMKLLQMLEHKTINGDCALVEWAVTYANRMSGYQRELGLELALWLQMPEIRVGLHFENDIRRWFEVVYDWHCRTGPINSRSGFRTLELYSFFKSYQMPWFNNAVADSSSACRETIDYINANFEDAKECAFRIEQVERGLRFGREELIKWSERYLFRAPLILIILSHHEDGPAFARATLSILYEVMRADDIVGHELVFDCENGEWDSFKGDKSHDELRWYNILSPQRDKLATYWMQIGMSSEKLASELQRLCSSRGLSYNLDGFDAPLLAFKSAYPILFECMQATFGLIPSNSRLVEQGHGMMRAKPINNIGMDQGDDKMSYLIEQEYYMREERRAVSSGAKRQKKAAKHDATKKQVAMIGHQIQKAVQVFLPKAKGVTADPNCKIDSITVLRNKGRLVQDKDHIARMKAAYDKKASNTRREQTTAEEVLAKARAAKTELSNDSWLRGMTDESMKDREKLVTLTTAKHWESIPTPGKYKGGHLMRLAYKSMPLFEMIVNVEAELKRMDVESRKKHFAKTGNMKKKKKIEKKKTIPKKEALGLIKLHNNRLKAMANAIADFADFANKPRHETVPREDFIQSFYKIESEEAWEHVEETPAAVATALESFCIIDTRYKAREEYGAELLEETIEEESDEDESDDEELMSFAYPNTSLTIEDDSDD